jgi:hypothetical protein
VGAGLIALPADIDLQRVKSPADERDAVVAEVFLKLIHELYQIR